MKKLKHVLMLAVFSLATLNIYSQASDLFFSEYAEGSSFNKYVEISNVTGAAVDLSMYQIKKGTNGADFTVSMTLSGTLADGDVHVVSRSDADPQILAFADELDGTVINFNGNDVMGLFKNEVLIDIIGMVGDDPGDGWDVAGVAAGTKDHTLVRKASVCDPITNWPDAAGTNADDSQWVVYDQNFWDELGMHTSDCSGGTTVATPVFSYPGGQYFQAIDVEITCNTPESQIYYTLDGSDPDESSTPYATALNISEATTLKARAYAAELDPSNIAQADYTFATYVEVPNLTELRDAFNGGTDIYLVSGEVILTYQQDFRGQKYIQDDAAGILIDDDAGVITTQYALGDGISGLAGTLAEFGNMLQFVPASDPGAPTSSGNEPEPVELTVAEMLSAFEDYEARLVQIPDVSFADQGGTFENGTVYQINDDSKAEGSFRTTFYDVNYIGTMIPAGAGTIVGILNSRTDGNYISSRSQGDLMWGVMGEPSNYPTEFMASASGTSISLSWMDATGETLPTGYLILGSDQDNFDLPQDGTPIANDTDFSDGMGALNIISGVQTASFSGLASETNYFFKIFPYTNTGEFIDYKTDGTPPAAQAMTEQSSEVDVLFTTFNDSWESWTSVSVVGDQVWDRNNTYGIDDSPCAKMSGYSGEAFDNEDWLISPPIDLSQTSNQMLSFFSASAYTGPALEVYVSTNYDGVGNPNDFTWDDLTDQAIWPPEGSFFEFTSSGQINIASYSGQSIYVAFKFTSTTSGSATWELDNIRVVGEGEVIVNPEPTNYPTDFSVSAMVQTITMSWTDATGETIPQGYLVQISDQTEIGLPEDGTEIANDTDLSDGFGAMNVMPGVETTSFSGLMENTMYYAVIVPYTNSGADIDYKTDGIPPTGSATTGEATPNILFTTFNEGWENWTPISALGDQVWDRDNSFGLEGTACAQMSGYDGAGSAPNEDWLISPAIDLTQTLNETVSFYSAVGYTGAPLQFYVSKDYDGSGNPNDFPWDNLTYQAQWPTGEPFWQWTESGSIDLSAYTNEVIYIAFIYTSDSENSATWEVENIRVQGEGAGLHENLPSVNLNVWPNPGNGIININAEKEIRSVEIYSATGALVFRQDNIGLSGQLNLSKLQQGIYFSIIKTDGDLLLNRRIIIQ